MTMTRAEALKAAVNLITIYQTLKACTEGRDKGNEGVHYIPVHYSCALTAEQIQKLSNYILENEDTELYCKTFGVMDLMLLRRSVMELGEIWDGWDNDIRHSLILGNYAYIREHSPNKCHFIFGVFETKSMLKAMTEEAMMLQTIYKNLIPTPRPDPSTAPDTKCQMEKWFESETGSRILNRLAELGFIAPQGDRWRWLGNGSEYGYFAIRVTEVSKCYYGDNECSVRWKDLERVIINPPTNNAKPYVSRLIARLADKPPTYRQIDSAFI